MAKLSGIGMELYFGGSDLSGCTASIENLSTPRTTIDKTGLVTSSIERVYGHSSGEMTVTTHFNDCAGKEHLRYRNAPTTDVLAMILVRPCKDQEVAMLTAKQVSYDGTRGTDGDFTLSVEAQSNAQFLEWGKVLVTKTSVSANGNSPSLNNCAASCSGVAVMIQVSVFSGTSISVALQESSDDGCTDAFATIACFTNVVGITAERKTVSGSGQEQYMRLNYSNISGESMTITAALRRGTSVDIEAY